MNFFDAMKELEKGNKVRNAQWKDELYLYKENNKICVKSYNRYINLPTFVRGSMYNNMKLDHGYSLKELGLDE